jgi:hypothetical protein
MFIVYYDAGSLEAVSATPTGSANIEFTTHMDNPDSVEALRRRVAG